MNSLFKMLHGWGLSCGRPGVGLAAGV